MPVIAKSAPDLGELPDDYPVYLDRVREDVPIALRAVITHQGQDWPTGTYCRNCRAVFPCRLRRWGQRVLVAAGRGEHDLAELVGRAAAGELPWARP